MKIKKIPFGKMTSAGIFKDHPQFDIEGLEELDKIKSILQSGLEIFNNSESTYQAIDKRR